MEIKLELGHESEWQESRSWTLKWDLAFGSADVIVCCHHAASINLSQVAGSFSSMLRSSFGDLQMWNMGIFGPSANAIGPITKVIIMVRNVSIIDFLHIEPPLKKYQSLCTRHPSKFNSSYPEYGIGKRSFLSIFRRIMEKLRQELFQSLIKGDFVNDS
ncbi:MAG: hypothetical protein JSV50_17620 [Desulfobacteraceae bacterium]|nr:MAG: hypothetical protein JSV50_17620 [Desulfobacteraceae bacterium]